MAERWKANEPWPKLEVEQLKQMRADGLGLVEIARRLQRTKNSVNSKIRQLKLPNMPVPYRPTPPKPGQPKREHPDPPQRAGAVTLPPLASLQEE